MPKTRMCRRIHAVLLVLCCVGARGSELQTIRVDALRAYDATLTGAGIHVAQAEAGDPYWEVNPAFVNQSESLFTWFAQPGTATTFPNALGFESGHANQVGGLFYGPASGAAPGVAHVDSYEAQFFFTNFIQKQIETSARLVNQSFILVGETATVELAYDHYADQFGTLFVSGIGNGGPVNAPATCYNGIGVAAYGGSSSTGPTIDGRSKPDIAAPGAATSYSTPLVAGAAAILLQSALRGDGGPNTTADASDLRTVKALLLTGAAKTTGWTNSQTTPLDPNFGAGVLNVYRSYGLLRAGKHVPVSSVSVSLGNPHPPPSGATATRLRRGWDFNTVSSAITRDGINHYVFEVTSATPRSFTFTSTLVWLRHSGETIINDLNLFLYNVDTNVLVASSESLVDNLEHIYATSLPPGRYNLQVFKRGGPPLSNVSNSESYGLAFEFGPPEPAQLSNAQHTAALFAARLTGEPEHSYRVQRTLDFISWTTVLTNTTSGAGAFDFSVAETGPLGFYRALRSP